MKNGILATYGHKEKKMNAKQTAIKLKDKWILIAILAAALSLHWTAAVWAGRAGLQTKFSMVTLENLEPGVTYNTRELVNLPLVVRNTGDEKAIIKVDVLVPQGSKSMSENHYE